MFKKIIAFSIMLPAVFSFSQAQNGYQDNLTGEQTLACEAVLCLSSSVRPSECGPAVAKFFSIWNRKPWKIPDMRFDFLALCPISYEQPSTSFEASPSEMRSFMRVIARGATMCSANYLNRTHWRMVKVKRQGGSKKAGHYTYYIERKQIIPTLPDICKQYVTHRYTDGKLLQTLRYDVQSIDDGKEFGLWRDNLMHLDSSSFSDEDNNMGGR